MKQRPSGKADTSATNQEILHILRNSMFHYSLEKGPPFVPLLSQINPTHALQTISLRPILIVFYHLRLSLPSGLCPSGFPHKTHVRASSLPHLCYMPHRSHAS